MRNNGCRIKWNTDRARELWIAGVKVQAIADELDVTYSSVMGAAIRWQWPPRVKPESEARMRGTVWHRCYNCGGKYRSTPDDQRDCCNRTPQPLSGVAA